MQRCVDSNMGAGVLSVADVALQREVAGVRNVAARSVRFFVPRNLLVSYLCRPKRVSNHSSHVHTWPRVHLRTHAITSALLSPCFPMSARFNFSQCHFRRGCARKVTDSVRLIVSSDGQCDAIGRLMATVEKWCRQGGGVVKSIASAG
jgi:hypothetical protein